MSSDDPPVAVPPVAIGGGGGSGTRLIADIVGRLGYHMGEDLNLAGDNLWFTLLFKRREFWRGNRAEEEFDRAVHVFRTAMVGGAPLTVAQVTWVRSLATADRLQHEVAWLSERAESLLTATRRGRSRPGRWGWKEPNTHVFLDRLSAAFPGMKYIHVVRNGLDMAYSENQNQIRLWGALFLGINQVEVNARASLKFWCMAQRRVAVLGEQMPNRFLWFNYDAFCAAPRDGLGTLLRFLGMTVDASTESSLLALVRAPDSIGRFKQYGLREFDVDDVAYVRGLGFGTECS